MLSRVSELRSTRQSALVDVINVSDLDDQNLIKEPTLVANTNLQDYRIIVNDTATKNGQIQLTKEQQQALHCAPQSQVRVMPLNVEKNIEKAGHD